MKYVEIQIEQDPMTKPVVTVPAYEVAVLRGIYGESKVNVLTESVPVKRDAPNDAAERGRLVGKYGEKAVGEVYRPQTDELKKAIAAAAKVKAETADAAAS